MIKENVKPEIVFMDKSKVAFKCIVCEATKVIPKSQWNRGVAKFCSISCGTKWRNLNNNPMKNKDNIEKMKKSLSETRKSMTEGTYTPNLTKERRDYRSIAFANKEHKCEICGEKNYGVLEVHHKDMNRDNNNISNLMIVCSKCHHLEIHKTIEIDLGHSFTLKYKTTSTRAEGSETNELISRLKELIVDLENNNSITHKRMMGETGGSY